MAERPIFLIVALQEPLPIASSHATPRYGFAGHPEGSLDPGPVSE